MTQRNANHNMQNTADAAKAAAKTIEKYMHGISYPANKDEIIAHARQNHAPSEIMQMLNQVSDRDYHNSAEISNEAARM